MSQQKKYGKCANTGSKHPKFFMQSQEVQNASGIDNKEGASGINKQIDEVVQEIHYWNSYDAVLGIRPALPLPSSIGRKNISSLPPTSLDQTIAREFWQENSGNLGWEI